MTAWVFLAFRDERLIGAGARLEDARQLCETKAAEMHEKTGPRWWPPETVGARAGSRHQGELIGTAWVYSIRRVPVARFAEGEGG